MFQKDQPNSTLELQVQQKQSLKLTQRLIMSAHMQQAIRLLQLPLLELETFIEEQIVTNPVLELEETKEEDIELETEEPETLEQEVVINDQDFTTLKQLDEDLKEHFSETEHLSPKKANQEDKFNNYLENSICFEPNLYQILLQEAHDTFEDAAQLAIAEILIGYIDEFGFLKTPLEEIALLHRIQLGQLKTVLKEIQTFEPYGVGATSIQESLLIQLRCLNKKNNLAYKIVEEFYDELIHNRIPSIQKALKRSYNEIQQAIEKDIAKLDLHPGTHFSLQKAQPVVPDVTLRQEDDQLIVDVNRDYAPNLKLNSHYLKLLEDQQTPLETKNFIKKHIFSARWLMRNLQQRYSTIERIAASLAQRQYEFFTQPNGQLVPLTMKIIAEELGLHESTIARTVSNKYINSPRGLFPLRSFFTSGYVSDQGIDLSSKTVQDSMLELIHQEDKKHPLSDEKICQLLKQRGIPCARRTVAKYRTILQIGNAAQRKKF